MILSQTIMSALVAALAVIAASGPATSPVTQPGKGVEFYLLADGKMDFVAARAKPLADLVLEAKPWIAADNIERYDWSCHCVYLKQPAAVPLPEGRKFVSLRGTPFVVVADGQRCYLGTLWSPASSILPEGSVPMIDTWGTRLDSFEITLLTVLRQGTTPTDARTDKRVMKALQAHGQYHAGLQCSLDQVCVERKDDSVSLVYTYTLKNLDEDNLYVMDPQKMSPALFHYFQNGVYGRDVDEGTVLPQAKPRQGDSPSPSGDKLDPGWLSRLKRGEKMTRTVPMEVMGEVLPGEYECQFSYRLGEFLTLKREPVHLPDGRLWLGRITAMLTVELPGKQP